jgi:hypothetical protein
MPGSTEYVSSEISISFIIIRYQAEKPRASSFQSSRAHSDQANFNHACIGQSDVERDSDTRNRKNISMTDSETERYVNQGKEATKLI